MSHDPSHCRALVLGLIVSFLAAGLARADEPADAFPTWEERVLHQWINRARVEPAEDLADCGTNCSAAELLPNCYTSLAPLSWGSELAVAARFHSESMARQRFFAHDTPCVLRPDLADVYPSGCDGSAACSCSEKGSTSPAGRAARFGAPYSGEIIAAGYADPVSAFYGWLHEPVSSAAGCAFTMGQGGTNGHRWLILKSSGSVGSGHAVGGPWGRYYTTDFGGGPAGSGIPSGAHYPRQGPSIEFWANWYDDESPYAARVVVGSVGHEMCLARGTPTNGAWTVAVAGLGTGCHRYFFEFTDSAGQRVRHPATGTFGIGPAATCPGWAPPSGRRPPLTRPRNTVTPGASLRSADLQ